MKDSSIIFVFLILKLMPAFSSEEMSDIGTVTESIVSENSTKVREFLEKYEYLPKNSINTSKLIPEEVITVFQKEFNLPETGELDGITRELMKVPKCGQLAVLLGPEPTPTGPKPNRCNMSYDAITNFMGDILIFHGDYEWRVNDNGPKESSPKSIRHFRRSLPENITKLDAVYVYPDRKMKLFAGKKFYDFERSRLVHNGSLSDLGISEEIEHISAFFVWGPNNSTVFFSGDVFWRFDETTQKVVEGYPQSTELAWKNVGRFDTAFKRHSKTYFFKGEHFFEFDDDQLELSQEPRKSSHFWMHCPEIEISEIL